MICEPLRGVNISQVSCRRDATIFRRISTKRTSLGCVPIAEISRGNSVSRTSKLKFHITLHRVVVLLHDAYISTVLVQPASAKSAGYMRRCSNNIGPIWNEDKGR